MGTLTACEGDSKNDKDKSADTNFRVAVALGSIGNTWHAQLRKTIDVAVTNYPDIEWTIENASDA